MPKRRRKKKNGTEAWKKLVRIHRKGPKRIKLSEPRSKNGRSPLTMPEHSKRVQIILENGTCTTQKIGVAIFNKAFEDMGLKQKEVYRMTRNKLTRAGHLLRECLDMFEHNDFILGRLKEKRLDNCVGKCIIMTGTIVNPDAHLYITPDTTKRTVFVPFINKKIEYDVEYM